MWKIFSRKLKLGTDVYKLQFMIVLWKTAGTDPVHFLPLSHGAELNTLHTSQRCKLRFSFFLVLKMVNKSLRFNICCQL